MSQDHSVWHYSLQVTWIIWWLCYNYATLYVYTMFRKLYFFTFSQTLDQNFAFIRKCHFHRNIL